MAKGLSTGPWHGVPRREIPWFPTVNPEKCIGCQLCFVTCGREVYMRRHRAPHRQARRNP